VTYRRSIYPRRSWRYELSFAWTGRGWVGFPLGVGGIVAGRLVGDPFGPDLRDLVAGIVLVLVSGGIAALVGRDLNSVVTPAGRKWRHNHTFVLLPLQFAGSWYALIAVLGIAGHYGRVVGAWLGWPIGVVGTVLVAVVTVRGLDRQPARGRSPDLGAVRRYL
jgi:hypothetical protein